jgi:hypothetical protein
LEEPAGPHREDVFERREYSRHDDEHDKRPHQIQGERGDVLMRGKERGHETGIPQPPLRLG